MTIKSVLSFLLFIIFLSVGYTQEYVTETIQHDGLTREYSIYVPASYDGTSSFPLLFNFHGGNDVIASWQSISDMSPLADTANFILVYPQARPDPSDGNSLNWLPKTADTFDDVLFINALIDTIASDFQINQNRIYACGYSLGGEFSYELACKLNSRIAAIGAVARTMQADPNSYCTPVHLTGVLTILGTDDPISPYDGLIYAGTEFYISAAETHDYWVTHNNCDTSPAVNMVSPSVERKTWSTASGCAYIEGLKVIGGGHDWPGVFGDRTINANNEIWQFVSRYDINGLVGCATTSTNDSNSKQENYSIYPNPINSILTVEMEIVEDKEFRIYSTNGELMISGKLTTNVSTIDLSLLPLGIYILNIDHQSIKLIKTE